MAGSVLQFPLRMGLAEDANPKAPPTSSLKKGVNVRWVKDGVIGKRFGVAPLAALPDGAGNIRRLIARDTELSATDGSNLYTYSPTAHTWQFSDRVSEASLEWSTLIDDEASVCSSDVGINGNVIVHAYVTGDPTRQSEMTPDDGGLLFVQVTHRETGQVLLKPVQIRTGARFVRVIVTSNWAIVLFAVGQDIYTFSFQVNEASAISMDSSVLFLAVTDVRYDNVTNGTNGRIDAILLPDGNIAVAYEKDPSVASGGFQLQRFSFNATTGAVALLGTGINAGTDHRITAIALNVDAATTSLVFSYCFLAVDGPRDWTVAAGIANYSTWTFALAGHAVATHHRAAHLAVARVGANFLVAWSGVQATSGDFTDSLTHPLVGSGLFNASTGAAIALTLRVSAGVALLSSIFALNGRLYAFARDAHYGENAFWSDDDTFYDGRAIGSGPGQLPSISSYLIELETSAYVSGLGVTQIPHRIVGKIDHDVCSQFQSGSLPRVAAQDGNTTFAILPFQSTASPNSFNLRTGIRLARATVDPALLVDPWRSVFIGSEAYFNGAILCVWDGRTVFDHAMRTPYVVVAASDDEGGLIADGHYIWQAYAHYRSNAGTLHRSPASRTFALDLASDSHGEASADIYIAPNAIDCKESVHTGFDLLPSGQSFYELFRTEANGSVLYQLSDGPRINAIRNAPTAFLVEFVDTALDTDITPASLDPAPPATPLASRPQAYTATGELEDVQAAAARTLCFHNDRLWLVSGNRRDLWLSKAITDNLGIAPGFNPDFNFVFEKDIFAIASYADNIFVFFEREVRFITGDGPTVANTDNRFSTPQIMQGEIGSKNPRSIVATPVGLFFQATGGDLYLIDGSLAVQWVGKDVRDTTAAFPTITSAVHIAEQAEVRFTCNAADGSSGIILVFDYQRGTWTTRTIPGNAAIADAILCNGIYSFAVGALVYRERVDTYGDVVGNDTVYVESDIWLNPIAPAGPISWHRVKRVQLIGTSREFHNLTIEIARDFAATTEQTKTWDGTSSVTQPGPLERAEVALKHQKAQAIEVHISDAFGTGFDGEHGGGNQGFELEGIAFLVQAKPGLAKIDKSRRG